ncbi:MAG: heme/hemin ABC transporter substrate-binding protein [Microbacteriaceae bacterium]
MFARNIASAILGTTVACALLVGCAATAQPTAPAVTESGPRLPLSQLSLLENARDFVGESTATLTTAAITAVTNNPEQSLPTTITSYDLDGDTEITVTSTDRVLGLDLSGSIAATIFGLGLGDTLVGRDVSTTFPGTEELPVVTTGGHSINSESILALRPTLVITDGTIGPIDVVLQLRDAGIPVVFVDTTPNFEGVAELARQVSAAMGAPAAGEMLAASLTDSIAAKVTEIASITPTAAADKPRILFLYLRGNSGIYYLFGEESGADVLIEAVGGIDVAGEIGWTGMKPVTDEALVSANPDLILVMTAGLASAGGVDGLIDSNPAIGLTRAGQNRRFVDMADGEILSFGPRTADVLDALTRAIYAPQS